MHRPLPQQLKDCRPTTTSASHNKGHHQHCGKVSCPGTASCWSWQPSTWHLHPDLVGTSSRRSCAGTSPREPLASSTSTMPDVSRLTLRLGAADLRGAHSSAACLHSRAGNTTNCQCLLATAGLEPSAWEVATPNPQTLLRTPCTATAEFFAAAHQRAALTWSVRQPSLEKPPLGSVAAARSENLLKPQSDISAQKQWLVSGSQHMEKLVRECWVCCTDCTV